MVGQAVARCSQCFRKNHGKLSLRGLCSACGEKRRSQSKQATGVAAQHCRGCKRQAGKRGSFATLSRRRLCPDCSRKLNYKNRSSQSTPTAKACNMCKRLPGKGYKAFSALSRRGLCPDCGKQKQKQAGLSANQSKAGRSSATKRLQRASKAHNAVKRLQRQTSKAQKSKPAAEMFSGSGRLAQSLRKRGWTCAEWDLRHGDHMDMTKKSCQAKFFAQMRAGLFLFIWFGTCCKTFSRATSAGVGPQPVRSNEHVWGFPDLNGSRLKRATLANKLARFTLKAIRLAIQLKLHWAVENPLTSMLWVLPGFKQLKDDTIKNVFVRVDYCQYGTSWQKPTAILSNCAALADVGATCHMGMCESSGTRRICSRSGECHVRLCGLDSDGVWNTSHAEPYPARLCTRIATVVDKSV
jgi:rubredoxin